MPTYRSISISLISQFGIRMIPEYNAALDLIEDSKKPENLTAPPPQDNLVQVYVPIYPCSHFWIRYVVEDPPPKNEYLYFRLSMTGQPDLSWGAGGVDDWAGKVVFGLQPSEEDGYRKMAFAFTGQGDPGCLEIKVFRARGRQIVTLPNPSALPCFPQARKSSSNRYGGGFELKNFGFAAGDHPTNYYRYALIDPTDAPFVTFRFHTRRWEQLVELGIIPLGAVAVRREEDLPVANPDESNSPTLSRQSSLRSMTLSVFSDDDHLNGGNDTTAGGSPEEGSASVSNSSSPIRAPKSTNPPISLDRRSLTSRPVSLFPSPTVNRQMIFSGHRAGNDDYDVFAGIETGEKSSSRRWPGKGKLSWLRKVISPTKKRPVLQ